MKRDLTLEDVYRYLPYGLKIQRNTNLEINKLKGLVDELVYVEEKGSNAQWCDLFDIKPVLYPFNLITPLESGEIPMFELAKIAFIFDEDDKDLEYGETYGIFEIFNSKKTCLAYEPGIGFNMSWYGQHSKLINQYMLFEYLYKNHLDVKNLIVEGLATNVYNLKINPYV